MTIEATVEFITPTKAKELLTHNHVNRSVRERVVMAYRKDMEDGHWLMTGEPIQFSKAGNLLNGQHRLTALSHCTGIKGVNMFVVRGLPETAQLLMDQGAPRSIADMLKLEGGDAMKNAVIVAAIARWLTLAPVPDKDFDSKLRRKCSSAAALATYRENPHTLARAAEQGTHVRNTGTGFPVSVAALGYCYFHFAEIDVQAANQFFFAFTDLSFMESGDPRKAAYQRIVRLLSDEQMKHGKMMSVATVSVLTRAWNMWRTGVEADTILVRGREGWIPPAMPV